MPDMLDLGRLIRVEYIMVVCIKQEKCTGMFQMIESYCIPSPLIINVEDETQTRRPPPFQTRARQLSIYLSMQPLKHPFTCVCKKRKLYSRFQTNCSEHHTLPTNSPPNNKTKKTHEIYYYYYPLLISHY